MEVKTVVNNNQSTLTIDGIDIKNVPDYTQFDVLRRMLESAMGDIEFDPAMIIGYITDMYGKVTNKDKVVTHTLNI